MSFSSLLPLPKNVQEKDVLRSRGENIVKSLVDSAENNIDGANEDIEKWKEDFIDDIYNRVASRVQLNDFIPLRQRIKDLSIPYPSQEEIDKTYERTASHFKSLIDKQANNKQGQKQDGGDTGELVTLPDGRQIHIVTRKQDPLQPILTKKNKKVYVPSNEEEAIQPQLHVASTASSASSKDKKDWQIPSFVSKWKNPKGYTTSSRGEGARIESHEINDGFVELAEVLEQADREARLRLQLKNEEKIIELNRQVREREERLKKITKEVRNNRSHIHPERQRQLKLENRDTSDGVVRLQENNTKSVAKKTKTVSYDSRLYAKAATSRYNTSNVYDNPLFVQQDIDNIYRINYSNKVNEDDHGGKKKSDETVMNNGPVQFTKAERDGDE